MHIRCVPWRRRSRTLTGRLAPGLALLALGACEVPTSLPEWDTLWIAPGQSTTISVASLLPAQVSVTSSGDAFQLDVAPVSFQESLGEACASCALLNGLTLPKPAFTIEISATAPLPSEVVSAKLASGQIAVALTHDFGFDPLGLGKNEQALKWYQQAELVHGRWAMLGVAGILLQVGAGGACVWGQRPCCRFCHGTDCGAQLSAAACPR